MATRRTALILALAALGGCRAILGIEDGVIADDAGNNVGDDARKDGPDSAPRFRKQITVASPQTTNLDGFAVPLLLGPDSDLAMHAETDGNDIHFTQGGVELPFEIVSYSATTGSLEAWVRVPSLTPSTQFYLEYGGSYVPTAGHVWEGAAGVWHFASFGFVGGYADSSPGNHDASTFVPPTSVVAIAGSGVNMTTSTVLTVGDPVDGSLDFVASFSLSLWVRVTSSVGMYDRALTKGGSTISDPGYDIELGAANWNVVLSDTVTVVAAKFGTDGELEGEWVHLAASIDRPAKTVTTFVNGQPMETVSLGATFGSIENNRPLSFGNSMYDFRGLLDEVRIYRSAKSGDWFHAEHALVVTNAAYVTVGVHESVTN